MLRRVESCCVVLCGVALWRAVSSLDVAWHVAPCRVVSCRVLLYCAALSYGGPFRVGDVVLCCVVSCRFVCCCHSFRVAVRRRSFCVVVHVVR